jgi:DNA-directed RNA polymerase II subunit RPB2
MSYTEEELRAFQHVIDYTKGQADDFFNQKYITGQLYSNKAIVNDLITSYDNWLINRLPYVLGEYACKLNDDSGMHIRVDPNTIDYDKPSIENVNNATRMSRDLYPKEARDKDLTYAVRIRGTFVVFDRNNQVVKSLVKTIGEVPCMVGSYYCHLYGKTNEELLANGECPHDPFAYFIVKGREFTLNIQANLAYNTPIIYTEQDKSKALVTNLRTTALTASGTFVNNVRLSESRSISVDTIVGGVKIGLNPFQVMRILIPDYGKLEDSSLESIISWMTKEDNRHKIKTTLGNTIKSYRTIGDDFNDIIQKRTNAFSKSKRSGINREIKDLKSVIEDLDRNLYPQMNKDFYSSIVRTQEDVRLSKVMYLMYNVALYLQYLIGDVKIDDRNNWATKQTCNVGIMFERLFLRILKNQYASFDGTIDSSKKSNLKDFETSYSHADILDKFASSIENNIWIVAMNQRATPEDKNVVLEKERNLTAHYSALNRINIPSSSKGRQTKVRAMHLSQLRYICIWETPEGERSGLVMSKGSSAVISIQRDDTILQKILIFDEGLGSFGLSMLYNPERPDYVQPCILNGKFMGFCNAEQVRYELVRRKITGMIDRETGVYIKNNALFISTMGGRLMCPTLVVGDGFNTERNHRTVDGELVLYTLIEDGVITSSTTYDDLTQLGCIEYMEPSEQEQVHVLIAQTLDLFNMNLKKVRRLASKVRNEDEDKEYQILLSKKYSHCEITPNSIIGLAASIVPLPHHNQPARNIYQASMGKQAQGIYHSNISNRLDREAKMLVSPARPIFSTEVASKLGLDEMPSGETVTLAITMDPFSQEDALTFKKGSIDRGLFNSVMYKTHRIVLKTAGETFDRLTNAPDPNYIKHKQSSYRNLHLDGLPIPGTYMEDGDCLVGIIHHESIKDKIIPRDISIYLTSDESGIVEKIYLYKNSNTSITVCIKVRSIRTPIPGDKFAARHAQKGTMGEEVADVDMPFDPKTGISPDVIYNTHGMPSRMTIGMLIEIIASSVGAITGRNLDASGFGQLDLDSLTKVLKAYGFSYKGTTVMYDGYHGTMLGKNVVENGVRRSIPTQVFTGPCYYQRLRHEVIEKGHERGLEGRVDPVTMLPTGGSDDGAIRFGEMERDAMISHGASFSTRERLITMADEYEYVGCVRCGTEGKFDSLESNLVCLKCASKGHKDHAFGKLRIPYSLFRLRRFLAVLGINMRYDIKPSNIYRPIPQKY